MDKEKEDSDKQQREYDKQQKSSSLSKPKMPSYKPSTNYGGFNVPKMNPPKI